MKLPLLLLAGFISAGASAQGLTQSAEGTSTIPFRGSVISLDLGKTELGFGLNNLRQVITKKQHWIAGGQVSAKNSEGIGKLFDKGSFVPTSKLSAFGGWSWSNAVHPNYVDASTELNRRRHQFFGQYSTRFTTLLTNLINAETDLGTALQQSLNQLVSAGPPALGMAALLASSAQDGAPLAAAKARVLRQYNALRAEADKKRGEFDDELAGIGDANSARTYWQVQLLGFGGIQSTDFKRFKGVDPAVVKNSFEDVYFRGAHYGAGINLQYGWLMAGLTFNWRNTDNFKLLTSKEYTLKDETTAGGQTLTSEKKITGYSGAYGKVDIQELNFDLIGNFKLDAEAKNHVLVNPYLRAQVSTSDKLLLPNATNIGCGFYFFQQSGKFLGGFYAELPDVKNNYEKAKPVDEQNLRPMLQRMTLGVVAKFSFSSMFNVF